MLLQTLSTDSLANLNEVALDATKENIGLLDLLIKGGYMMIPLYILLVLAIFIFFEKLITLKKSL